MSEVKCGTCKGEKHLEFERGQRRVPCVTCSGSGIDWRRSCESAQSELAALREELASNTMTIQELAGANDEQQQRLTAAEQRNAALEGLLRGLCDNPYNFTATYRERIKATLDPTESGASES
jgi:DnaJ-class molecular chaperone